MSGVTEPADEDDRLAALASMHILDTGRDARFDNFVELAADLMKVPIALITFLDKGRQWFKASVGVTSTQTPRQDAFCNYAIANPAEVFVVEDTHEDPRFSTNPLVVSNPRIRFYAGASVRSPTGHPLGTLCVIDRVPRTITGTARQQLQRLADGVSALLDLHRTAIELQRAATHDPLTGLANRALFDQRLDLAVADGLMGRPCALLLVDLDRFKQVNDRLGNVAGDLLLRVVGQRLRDVVHPASLVARLGGDKFAVLHGDLSEQSELNDMVARITAALGMPVVLGGEEVVPRATIGGALCPADALEPGALLRTADLTLYQAKRAGGGHALLAGGSPGQVANSTPGRDLGSDLKAALKAGEIEVHWQAYVKATTGVVRGVEALARWRRPGHGIVEPNLFIPFAEVSGLIGELDSWMLESACRQAASWDTPVQISVNLSAHWFGGADLVGLVERTAIRTGLPLNRLCIEVTERTLIAARQVAREQIDALRAMGVRVALDDFGVGFSSLGYLRDLPFDKLKLDRSFVTALGTDVRAEQVAGAIIRMGHLLGMTVCAEGVETPTQMHCLKRQGCDSLQGYLLGAPGPEPDLRPRDVILTPGAVSGGVGWRAASPRPSAPWRDASIGGD